jgi:hypothetical protein
MANHRLNLKFDFAPYKSASYHPIYQAWLNINSRCHNESRGDFKFYGGRSIIVEEPWRSSLQSFIDDMFPMWKPKLTIERKDVNGNYCKTNCTWITQEDQAHNRRDCIHLTFNGERLTLGEWARKLGISPPTVSCRHACNWPIEAVLFKGNFMTLKGIQAFSLRYPHLESWAHSKLQSIAIPHRINRSQRKDGRVVQPTVEHHKLSNGF